MPFCPKCGEKVAPEATFCYYCGEPLPKKQPFEETKAIPTTQPVPAPPPKPMPEESPLPTSHRSRNIIIVIALVVIVIAAGIVAYAFATGLISASTFLPQPRGTYAMSHVNYSFSPSGYITIVEKNIGNAGPLTIGSILIDGAAVNFTGGAEFGPGTTTTVVTTSGPITDSLSHQVRIVSTVGAADAFLIVYSGYQPLSFFPTTFHNVVVNYNYDQGIYKIAFSLANDTGNNGASNGTLLFEITDLRNHILYESSFSVNSAAFQKTISGDLFYSWSFPSSNVKAGVPNGSGFGSAALSFTTANSTLFSSGTYAVEIPILPRDTIIPSFSSDSATQLNIGGLVPGPPIFANDSFIQTFQVESTGPSVTITDIATTTPGFTVLSITPQTPFTVGSTWTNVTLNISTPSQAYNGSLGIFIYTQSQP